MNVAAPPLLQKRGSKRTVTNMQCLHPHCPAGNGLASWDEVLAFPAMKLPMATQSAAAPVMNQDFGPPAEPPMALTPPPITKAALVRLLKLCPCLFNQLDIAASARAVVHFCELTLGAPVTAANVHEAFLVQHPKKGPDFNPGPLVPCGDGGKVMEMLCSEVLASAGLPAMISGGSGWPEWQMPGHILLNEGKMSSLQALGDILVPCAPTNLVISVKSEVARERLLYSANSIEGIGFGFFREPEEFWTQSRMSLFKRMGFTAIYMPDDTHAAVMQRVAQNGLHAHAVNINGTALYRPLTVFGEDMQRVVGRSSAML
jgi:hypothetical protein